jgi:hypothetical protein
MKKVLHKIIKTKNSENDKIIQGGNKIISLEQMMFQKSVICGKLFFYAGIKKTDKKVSLSCMFYLSPKKFVEEKVVCEKENVCKKLLNMLVNIPNTLFHTQICEILLCIL